MPRPISPASDQEESNDQQLLQDELDMLKHKVKVHTNDKMKYEEEVKFKLKKYYDEISHLERDNKDLQVELDQAECEQNKKSDQKNLKSLNDLANRHDKLMLAIEDEKQKQISLGHDISRYEKLVKKKKASSDNSDATSKDMEVAEVQLATQRKVSVLENRLDKQNKHYNWILTQNGGLREDIEKLRNERSIFVDMQSRLSEKLCDVRHERDRLTASATQAYDQRDEANSKCVALKEKNDKDVAQFQMEMRDLQRIVDHDQRLREFMNAKSNERLEWKRQEEERRKKHGSAGELARQQQRKQIDTYEEAFSRIKAITGEEELAVIVDKFVKKEDENFALFQYVSELNNRVENVTEDIERIRREIDAFDRDSVKLEHERKRILADLSNQMEVKKQEADKAKIRLTEVNKILDQLRTGIESVFTKIGCDSSVILEILGGDKHISNRNMMLYLGSVEERTNAMLAVEYYMQVKQFQNAERKEQPQYGLTLGLAADFKPVKEANIVPPAIGDEFKDDSDGGAASADELRPLSQHELYNRVANELKGRGAAGGGAEAAMEMRALEKPANKTAQ